MLQDVLALCRGQEDVSCRNVIYRLTGSYDSLPSALCCWVVEKLVVWEWVSLSEGASSMPLTEGFDSYVSTGENALDWEGDAFPAESILAFALHRAMKSHEKDFKHVLCKDIPSLGCKTMRPW